MIQLNTLVLANSASPSFYQAVEYILPYLDHFGVPYLLHDLNHAPLPAKAGEYALILVAQAKLDPYGNRLGRAAQASLAEAVKSGCGLVSFDPRIFSPAQIGAGGQGEVRGGAG